MRRVHDLRTTYGVRAAALAAQAIRKEIRSPEPKTKCVALQKLTYLTMCGCAPGLSRFVGEWFRRPTARYASRCAV